MSVNLTVATINKFVRTTLGEPVIVVELENEQIEEMISQALGLYGTYKPIERIKQFQVLASQQKYTFSTAECGRGIIEYFKPDLLRQPISLEQFDVFKYHTHLPNLDPGDFFMERVWWEEVRRSAGSDDDWDFEPDPVNGGGSLYVNPIPSDSYSACYIYVCDPTLTQVPPTDDRWIKSYTLALCKEILGNIRSKFEGVDGQESAIRMDGMKMREEGASEKEKLEDYLMHRGQIIAPIRG